MQDSAGLLEAKVKVVCRFRLNGTTLYLNNKKIKICQTKFRPARQFHWDGSDLPTWKRFFCTLYKNTYLAHKKQNRKETVPKRRTFRSLHPLKLLEHGRNHSSTTSETFSQNKVSD